MSRHPKNCIHISPEAKAEGVKWLNEHSASTGQRGTLPLLHALVAPPVLADSPSHDSISAPPSPYLLLPTHIPYQRSPSPMPTGSLSIPSLSAEMQESLEQEYLCACVSAGWSFMGVENPEVVKFLKMLNPAFKIPNRNKLSRALLDAEYTAIQNNLTAVMKDGYATAQCDGWRDVSHNNVVVFMILAKGVVS